MAKNALKCKEMMIKEISKNLEKADTLIITRYKGLSNQDLNELRKGLKNISGDYLVVKNSMAKKALSGGQNNSLTGLLEGEVGIAIDTKKDPSNISKVLIKFSKDHEALKICGGIMEGAGLSKEDIIQLASLPSKEVMIARLANVLNAPIYGLACSLKGIISKLVYVLDALKEKKPESKTETGQKN